MSSDKETVAPAIFHNVPINTHAQRKAIFRDIKIACFMNKGLVFGGMPRDEIIQEHYSELFREYASENGISVHVEDYHKKFWDTTFHPETAARTLVPNDADVFFHTSENANNFIERMKVIFPGDEFHVPAEPDNLRSLFYAGSSRSNIIVKKCTVMYSAGKTRTFDGVMITVSVDIVYPRGESATVHDEPPFGSCDMMCNIFVEDSLKCRRISKNVDSGAWFTSLSTYKKSLLTTKVIQNMLNFQTDIIKEPQRIYNNFHDVERYVKMMSRPNFPWTIKNLPYTLVKSVTIEKEDAQESDAEIAEPICCICQENLNSPDNTDTSIAVINAMNSSGEEISGSKIHHSCLLKSFTHQLSADRGITRHRRENTLQNCVKCPYKSPINFGICLYKIKWKDTYLTL